MNRILLSLCLLLLAPALCFSQTTQPAAPIAPSTQVARPPASRVVGWVNHGAESQTAERNVSYINPAPPSTPV
jgi:hypothetical protein